MTIFITTCKYSITLRFKNTVIVHIFYINYLIDIKIDLRDNGRKKNIFVIVIWSLKARTKSISDYLTVLDFRLSNTSNQIGVTT
jgi:hypothetical protein